MTKMKNELKINSRPAHNSWAIESKQKKIISDYFSNENVFDGTLYEKKEDFGFGIESHWFEYIPSTYSGNENVPLVVSAHAGNYYALAQVFDSSWCEIAERENFIVLFPEAHNRGQWETGNIYSGYTEPDSSRTDFRVLLKLICSIAERYKIDKSRIYMHGFSNGNLFTIENAMMFPDLFAGIGESNGPHSPDLLLNREDNAFKNAGAVPAWQLHSVFDRFSSHPGFDRDEVNRVNRLVRMELNECNEDPVIHIASRELWAYYKGKKADYIYKTVTNKNHCELISDAEECWQLFSTVRRAEDGTIISTVDNYQENGDKNGLALLDNCSFVYASSKAVNAGAKIRLYREVNNRHRTGGFQNPELCPSVAFPTDGQDMCVYFYVPLRFISSYYGFDAYIDGDYASAMMNDGRIVKFASGSSAAVINNRIFEMGESARILDGEFCIPIDWFAEYVLNLCTAKCGDMIYIADHQVCLTPDFVEIISEVLKKHEK